MNPPTYPFPLPPLRFAYDALEPHIDTQTMELHHRKHHQNQAKVRSTTQRYAPKPLP